MSEPGSITRCILGLREGQSQAAAELWDCYYARLVALARKKLKAAPRRVADEEDVVLSAFDSFCRGAEQGRFPDLADRDDLWQVLVMLTARKAANQLKFELRQRRGGGRVRGESAFLERLGDEAGVAAIDQVVGSEPTPQFAAQVAEQCQELLQQLDDPSLTAIALAKMEGYTNDEIAGRLRIQTRTIERKLRLIREIWSQP
jgi:DNA-directed RNA polymerase specialized sigma24 family protein